LSGAVEESLWIAEDLPITLSTSWKRSSPTVARAIADANCLFAELDAATEHSPLPEHVDLGAIGRLVTQISLDAWDRWGWSGKRSTVLEL
jgi:hypothetical protein